MLQLTLKVQILHYELHFGLHFSEILIPTLMSLPKHIILIFKTFA